MFTNQNDFVVVFGSAVAFVQGTSVRTPRDIDVAFGGAVSAHDAEQIARKWADENELPSDLPVDTHREYAGLSGSKYVVFLPVPEGLELFAKVLAGNVYVEPRNVRSAPAMIRKFSTIYVHPVSRENHASLWAHDLVHEIMRNSEYREFNIDPNALKDAAYTGCGVVAWRNAWSHLIPEMRPLLLKALNDVVPGIGDLVKLMLDTDIDVSKISAILPAHGKCAGGIGILHFGRGTWKVSLPYSCQHEEVSLKDLVACLRAPKSNVQARCVNAR